MEAQLYQKHQLWVYNYKIYGGYMNKNIVDKTLYHINESTTKKVILKNDIPNISTILFELKNQRNNLYFDLNTIPKNIDESSIITFLELSISYKILDYISIYYIDIYEKYFVKEKLKLYYLLELYYEELKNRGRSILGLKIGDFLFPILEKINCESNINELNLLIENYDFKEFLIKKNLEMYFQYFSKIILISNCVESKKLKKSY